MTAFLRQCASWENGQIPFLFMNNTRLAVKQTDFFGLKKSMDENCHNKIYSTNL